MEGGGRSFPHARSARRKGDRARARPARALASSPASPERPRPLFRWRARLADACPPLPLPLCASSSLDRPRPSRGGAETVDFLVRRSISVSPKVKKFQPRKGPLRKRSGRSQGGEAMGEGRGIQPPRRCRVRRYSRRGGAGVAGYSRRDRCDRRCAGLEEETKRGILEAKGARGVPKGGGKRASRAFGVACAWRARRKRPARGETTRRDDGRGRGMRARPLGSLSLSGRRGGGERVWRPSSGDVRGDGGGGARRALCAGRGASRPMRGRSTEARDRAAKGELAGEEGRKATRCGSR